MTRHEAKTSLNDSEM